MRRADRILKSDGHYDRALDSVGEILYVEITQDSVEFILAHSLCLCSLDYRLARPAGKLEIVPVVIEERCRWSDGLEPVVKRSRHKSERAALAFTVCKYAAEVGLFARAHEIDASHDIHEGTTIIICLFAFDSAGAPVVSLSRLAVEGLVAAAEHEFYPFRIV